MVLARINGTPLKIHPLILEHGYLVISELSAAIMKGLVNVSRKISSVPELITHCVEFNVPFKLAVPASTLHLFQRPLDDYSGTEAIGKLLGGPSYVASHLFNVDILPSNFENSEALMAESLTIGEEMALAGFVTGCSRKGPRLLFPTVYLLIRYLKGYTEGWTEDAEALMRLRWNLVLRGEAEAMTEEEWERYLAEFYTKRHPEEGYILSESDADYGIDLFKSAYPKSWVTIRLRDMTFPETYQGTMSLFEGH
ncbi:hypothetical protein ARMSODRAFT_982792 [Armillaria solidipes]|uniref:Uncharacterized protein n=1 Tax=Armillaria solidipes TaxID=1076256 RepID=A0A2H3ALD9_9AGAR|nr:hypothetical protein ARMSODRAFT_982792 [Armillaria solidipes]